MSSNYGFPYDNPYPTQLELMNDVYQTIENKRIGFYESPTGTGKTLTLLCGSLSWLSDHYRKIEHQPEDLHMTNNEPEWLRRKREDAKEDSKRSYEHIIPSKKYKKTKVGEHSNLDDRISNLVKLLDDSDDEEKDGYDLRPQNFGQNIVTPKIIFCSRTHSQLLQVVSELRKTSFFKTTVLDSFLNLATSTASRKNLCINKDLRDAFGSSSAINEACNDLISTDDGCPFYNRKKDPAFKDHLDVLKSHRVLDIEDITNSGTASQCCPYFSSRFLVKPASFVATPYNSIFDKTTRKAYGIDLSDNIVIFDEAHNIIDFIKQSKAVLITSPQCFFEKIVNCIDEYLNRYEKRLRGSNASALSQLKIFFSQVYEFSKKGKYGSFSVNDFVYLAQIDSFNFSKLLNHVEETKLFTKVMNGDLKASITQINGLLHALESGDRNGRFILSETEFKYVCTDVVEFMSDIIEQCRSVIFCGGTMSPLPETIKQLVNPSLQIRTDSKSLDHIINSENIKLSLLSTGPTGISLNFSYESRLNAYMIKELGMILTNYARIIPAGLVVFFTSFNYMDHVIDNWRSGNIFTGLEAIKKVFIEKKGEISERMLADYELIVRSNSGAIIFAVMGGKLSEGINFSDDLGRGVITVGMPYPNIHDLEIQEQMNAYINLMIKFGSDRTKKQLETDFLETSCMRIMNQTIGRVIRHKNDYASIIMIDERINRESIIQRLPKWVLPSLLDRTGKFGPSFSSVTQFFKKRTNALVTQNKDDPAIS